MSVRRQSRRRLVAGTAAGVANVLVLRLPTLALDVTRITNLSVVTYLVLAWAFAAAEAAGQLQPDRATNGHRTALATGVVLLLLSWVSCWTGKSMGPVLIVVGSAWLVWGISLRVRAMRALGSRFVTEVRAGSPERLVQSGVFSRRRHPSETGLLAIGLGTAVLLGSGPGLLMWAVLLVPLVIYRTRQEDAHLTLAFGSHHREYSDRVGSLL